MMRPSALQPLLGVLLCLLLALDAVGAAAAAVRSLGGSCAPALTADGTAAMPMSGHGAHDAHGAMQGSHAGHVAVASHADGHAGHDAQTHDAQAHQQAHHGHPASADHPQDSPLPDHTAPAPADDCRCDDGSCACPAACSLALTGHACPTLGARAPGDMTTGLAQHARPAPPQPDTLRPPIG